VYDTHHSHCGGEHSEEYNRALRQYRAEIYDVLRQAVTKRAGNKADTEELGPPVGYNCSFLCWLVLANLHQRTRLQADMVIERHAHWKSWFVYHKSSKQYMLDQDWHTLYLLHN